MDEGILPPPYVFRENAEERARLILEKFRWPDGKPTCPKCGSQRPIYKQSRQGVQGYYRCPALHPHPSGTAKPFVFTVRTGTLLERSHVPLDKWLYCLACYARMRSHHWILPASALATHADINRKTATSIRSSLNDLRFRYPKDDQANKFLVNIMAAMPNGNIYPLD